MFQSLNPKSAHVPAQSCYRAMAIVVLAFGLLAQTSFGHAAPTMTTPASNAIVLEMETGAVLFEKAPDETFPPASMAKMMTIYIAFEQLATGAIEPDSKARVSDEVWRRWAGTQASLMFLGAREEVTIDNLLMGLIVPSGNDAASVIAQTLAGTEEAFVVWMNDKAQELGMDNTRFANPSGWPAPDQYTTVRDMAILAERTIRDFPELYNRYYPERRFTYGMSPDGKPITQSNRNPLLFTMDGADGLKTGHTSESGYALTGSAVRDGRRLIMVVTGLDSTRARAQESERLMGYGFRNFNTYKLFEAGQVVDEAVVWLGDRDTIPLVVEDDVKLTLGRGDRRDMKVSVVYDAPIPAPIEAGQPLAVIEVTAPDMDPIQIPLVAGDSSDKLTGFSRVKAAFNFMLWGASGLD